jgi:hypothetical protein
METKKLIFVAVLISGIGIVISAAAMILNILTYLRLLGLIGGLK